MKIISDNRKARHNYEILKTIEVGIVLKGSEVKSIKQSQVSIKESYIIVKSGELFIQQMNVSNYKHSAHEELSPDRLRKLLCHKEEVYKIQNHIEKKSLSCVPLKVYLKKGLVKIEIALVRGKTKGDKRQSLKEKADKKKIRRTLRNRKRS